MKDYPVSKFSWNNRFDDAKEERYDTVVVDVMNLFDPYRIPILKKIKQMYPLSKGRADTEVDKNALES